MTSTGNSLNMLMQVRYNPHTDQRQLHALVPFAAHAMICDFGAAEVLTMPSYLTLQTGIDRHILLTPEILQYCNHSCAPNVFFDTTLMRFMALQEIGADEELTFFYPSTEWEMAQPFDCNCGTPQCLGVIQGAAWIAEDILSRYRLTDFIEIELEKRKSTALPAAAMP